MFSKKNNKVIKIEGMKCGHCAAKVEESLKKIDGVKKVKINLDSKEAIVTLSNNIDNKVLEKAITDLDYKVIEIS